MTRDTRIALFLIGELVAALRANDSDLFRQWLAGGIQDLEEEVVEELPLDWFELSMARNESDPSSGIYGCYPCPLGVEPFRQARVPRRGEVLRSAPHVKFK